VVENAGVLAEDFSEVSLQALLLFLKVKLSEIRM
jgi:hypothetical protein